ncbi:MAG TPA: ferredoxin, partial [Clostridiales bacterium]|nr:ferredoxin [Clostridiales bacterium]
MENQLDNTPKKQPRLSAKSRKRLSRLRTAVQILFFVLVLAIVINKTLAEKYGVPLLTEASLHAICPFGGVVTLYTYITAGRFVQKIHDSSIILMILSIVLAVGFGPLICGWVCPFGSFQEWLGKIGRKIFGKRYNSLIPDRIDRILRYSRYILLALVIYNTASTAKLMFQNIDPYFALFNFWTNEVALTAYIILGATLLLSLIIERPWCKYACPYGAFLGVFNLFRVFRLKRDPSSCIDCKACDRACPMNIKVSAAGTVRDPQCISCM